LRRIVAILNPQADRGRTAQLAEALREMARGRLELALLQTVRRWEAVELVRDAARSGCDGVAAIGGDGTVHEVANGLMALPADDRPPLGVVAAGSGNDFAYALGITKDVARCLDTLCRGAVRAVDVGEVRTAIGGMRFCLNNVGMLLEGEVNLASHELTWPRGSGLYVRALLHKMLRRLPDANLALHIDGATLERNAALLSIANGPRSGGKFFLMPDAKVDDGQFDFLLAPRMNRLRLLWKVGRVLCGKPLGDRSLERGKFKKMMIHSSIPLAAHVDGEPWLRPDDGVREMTLEVMPGALNVICESIRYS
jgi:YegS/Rv2252/BmrU family lipid kinase